MGVGKGSVLAALSLALAAQAAALPVPVVGNLLGGEASDCAPGDGSAEARAPPSGFVPAGGSWEDQSSPTTRDLLDVAFADGQHGWAVGNGVILGTTDGGATWRVQREDNGYYTAVEARGPQHAWVLSVDRQLLETTDGGATWVERLAGGWVMDEHGLAFDGDRGWFAGMDAIFTPNVWRTTDGGATWGPVGPLPPAHEEAWLGAVAAFAGGALVAGVKWNGDGLVLRTLDEGASWCIAATTDAALLGLDVAGNVAFAVGGNGLGGAVYRSLDGGATWSRDPFVVAPMLRDVDARDPAVALAVGADGAALLTTTGGLLWMPEAVPTLRTLRGVAVAPATAGGAGVEAWAVGDGGTIEHRTP